MNHPDEITFLRRSQRQARTIELQFDDMFPALFYTDGNGIWGDMEQRIVQNVRPVRYVVNYMKLNTELTKVEVGLTDKCLFLLQNSDLPFEKKFNLFAPVWMEWGDTGIQNCMNSEAVIRELNDTLHANGAGHQITSLSWDTKFANQALATTSTTKNSRWVFQYQYQHYCTKCESFNMNTEGTLCWDCLEENMQVQ